MSDIDPRTLANGDLAAEVATLSAQLDVAEHRLLALIGANSTAASAIATTVCRRWRRVAKALAELPHISTAFSRAEVSYSKVRAMTRVATPGNEAPLLYMAKEASAAQLETLTSSTSPTDWSPR